MDKFKKLVWLFVSFSLLTATVFTDDEEELEAGNNDTAEDKTEIPEENDVMVVTDDNFDKAIATSDVILFEFYAPWCGHCKTLAPEYVSAAMRLKGAKWPVPLAKVDGTVNPGLMKKLPFEVSGYPTLKLKKGEEWIDYDGPRDADGIVKWVGMMADPNYVPPPDSVVTVTQDTFDDFIKSADLVLVEFYAPWCGHCKKLAPEYEQAASRLMFHDPPIFLGKVDATVEPDLAKRFDVTGYPTLKLFRKGREEEYKGGRDAVGIVDYMHKQSGEAAKLLPTMKDVKNSFDKEMATVIGFFDNLEDEKLKAYMSFANELRDDVKFGYTLLPEARDLYKVNPGSVVVFAAEKFYTKYEPKYHVLKTAGKSQEEIGDFVKEKMIPLVGQYSKSMDKFYGEYQKKTLCFAFYTVDWSFDHRDATQMWRRKVANIAKDYKDIKFAIADEEEYMTSLMKEIGLDQSGEEFNVGCFKNGKKYRMEPIEEYDEDEIREFLNKLQKGKLKPQIKSQPKPKKNTGPVKVVVGNTFEEIVLDKTKDVLLEIYAPWCGHCKNLEPIYNDLGKAVKKEKNLVIAKIDATSNDIPENYKSSGFPTIYFAAANSKENPVSFDGDRTLEGFKQYLKEKASVSFGKSLREEL